MYNTDVVTFGMVTARCIAKCTCRSIRIKRHTIAHGITVFTGQLRSNEVSGKVLTLGPPTMHSI